MPFGENVGSAYVKLYADGSDVPDDIDDVLDKLDDQWRKAGAKHSKAYNKGFNDQNAKESRYTADNLSRSLQKGLGKMDAIGGQLGKDFWDGLQLQISREIDDSDLGERIRLKLEDDFARHGSFTRVREALENINEDIIDFTIERNRDIEESVRHTIEETDRLVAKTRGSVDDLGKSYVKLGEANQQFLRAEGKGWADLYDHVKRQRAGIGHLDNAYQRFNHNLDKQADLTGRLFGKGSRNNFLNFVGSVVGGLTKITFSALKAGSKLGEMFSGAGGKLDFTQALTKGLAGLFGLAIALTAVVAVAGPVAALISGISAALVGLAGSLVFAAGAVGGVALALSGPLVAGIGVAVLALTHLDKQTKDTLSSMKDEFSDLGDVAGKAIGPGLRAAAQNLEPVIGRLTPLVRGVSEALGEVAEGWSKAFAGENFQRLTTLAENTFPKMIKQLGSIASNVAGGIGGIFRAALPFAQRFLSYLDRQTSKFSDWANSFKGQQELRNFFERASESAESLWGWVVDTGDAILTLLSKGKDSGDTILDKLAENARKLTDYLNDPKNQDAIRDFFANGVDVAEEIGETLLDIVDTIDDFDTKQARKELQHLFDIIQDVLDVLGKLVDIWQWFYDHSVIDLIVSVRSNARDGDFLSIFPAHRFTLWVNKQIRKAFTGVLTRATGVVGDLSWAKIISTPVPRILRFFRGLAGRIADAIGDLGWTRWSKIISNPTSRVTGWFRGLAGRLAHAAGNINWGSIVKDPTAGIVKWFSGLAGRLVKVAGNVNWSDIITNPVDEILGWFSGLGSAISSAIGSVTIDINIPDPTPGFDIPGVPYAAAGGLLRKPTLLVAGEAGREAIVPLDRPLSQVDPSVRALSAIAQGLGGGAGVVVAEGAIRVVGVSDPEAAATVMLNDLVRRIA